MQEHHQRDLSVFDQMYNWLEDATHHELEALIQSVEQARLYIRAMNTMAVDEVRTLEHFLMSEHRGVWGEITQQAQHSIWLDEKRHLLLSLLSQITDQHPLQLNEMRHDIAHQGVFAAGEQVASGDFACNGCGHIVKIDFVDRLSPCFECGNRQFSRHHYPSSGPH